jgi:SAM domain (Sterile alpha motif)
MDVADWLRALGLERYEAAFRENGVSAEDLRHLTAGDLEELGVAGVGHRRRLLVAIAQLNEQRTTDGANPVVAPVATVSGSPREDVASHGGERRQLTVMFCDLVGSTCR